jgi:hypothetical protein
MAFELVRGGPCPSCGAPIAFASGAAAAQVCRSCSYVVARTDRDLRAIGRVGDLVAIKSPFAVGQTGTFEGKRFRLAGKAQYDRATGPSAPWEELYVELSDSAGTESWMWLAHAQGQWIVTTLYPHRIVTPPFERALPGASVEGPGGDAFQITERGERRAIAAQGDLPFAIDPSETERFADLSGQRGQFGTIDFGDAASPPQIYFGRVIDPRAFRLDDAAIPVDAPAATLAALECPACGGNLPLAVPDLTERIVCRYCGMASDVNAGALIALQRVPVPTVEPAIPLGARGHLRGRDVTLIGFMVRATSVDDEWYRWREYLLYAGADGFVWLVEEDGRWEHIVPIPLGDLQQPSATSRIYQQERFERSQTVSAVVESVVGEFYWKIAVGETVVATEFTGAKRLKISEERTPQEISASLSTPLTLAQLRRAFGVAPPPAKTDAAKSSSLFWLVLCAMFLVVAGADFASARREVVFQHHVTPPAPGATPTSTGSGATGSIDPTASFSEPFAIRNGERNLVMTVSAPSLQNTWVGAEIALVNLETGTVWEDSVELSYYSGVTGGESWSEGDRDTSLRYSRLPAGKYVLRIEAATDPLSTAPPAVDFKLVSDQPSLFYFLAASAGIFIFWLFHGRSRKKAT